MKRITSKENVIYRGAVKLTKKKHRNETGRYLVEGIKPILDAEQAGISLETLFLRESAAEDEMVKFLTDHPRAVLLSDDLFSRLSETQHSQGVVGVARRIRREAAEPKNFAGLGGRVLILDRLQDPGNIGTIIRTAEAAGFKTIVTMPGTVDPYSPKVVRAASGALFRMPVLQAENEKQITDCLHEAGISVIVTALEDAEDCFETELRSCALVIGNEGSGVSREFLELADRKVKIPMEGEIESLNAAVAAGILMYRMLRER